MGSYPFPRINRRLGLFGRIPLVFLLLGFPPTIGRISFFEKLVQVLERLAQSNLSHYAPQQNIEGAETVLGGLFIHRLYLFSNLGRVKVGLWLSAFKS
jgi:hypothetical protein